MRMLSIVVVACLVRAASADADRCADQDPSGDFDLKLTNKPTEVAEGMPVCAFAKDGWRVHYEVVADLSTGYLRVSNEAPKKAATSVVREKSFARSLSPECKRKGAKPRIIGAEWEETIWMGGKKYRASGTADVHFEGYRVMTLLMAEERKDGSLVCYANLSNIAE